MKAKSSNRGGQLQKNRYQMHWLGSSTAVPLITDDTLSDQKPLDSDPMFG